MTQEELINGVKSALPDGTYNEMEMQLAFYHYCLTELVVSESYLESWYIDSVARYNDHKLNEPIWTNKHIEELVKDFYLIPKKTEL